MLVKLFFFVWGLHTKWKQEKKSPNKTNKAWDLSKCFRREQSSPFVGLLPSINTFIFCDIGVFSLDIWRIYFIILVSGSQDVVQISFDSDAYNIESLKTKEHMRSSSNELLSLISIFCVVGRLYDREHFSLITKWFSSGVLYALCQFKYVVWTIVWHAWQKLY